MEDRRKLKRRHIIYYLRIFDQKTGQLIGHLVDITAEGIMVISENPLETDKDYALRITLPSEITGKKELNFNAHAIWCKKDINPDFYDTGYQLIDVEPEDVRAIEWLVTRFGFRD